MRTPSLQPVQVIGLDVDGDLNVNATPRFGTPSDVNNGALRAAPFGDNASGGAAAYGAFFTISDFGGIDPANLLGQVVAGFNYGPDVAGAIQQGAMLPGGADALDESALFGPFIVGRGFNGTDGAGYDRLRTGSAVNLDPTLTAHPGVQMGAKIGEWAIRHAPAANTIATISKAAVAGARHVCTSFSFYLSGTAAVLPNVVFVHLRDGATGAGVILQTWNPAIAANGVFMFGLSGLNFAGSVNTAMTIEFSAAGGANTYEGVNLGGYTIS